MNFQDNQTTIKELQDRALKFRDERNWLQFHKPKDLAAGVSVEAAELQELFLWKSHEDITEFLKTEKGKQRISEEIADTLMYLLYLADRCEIDLSQAVIRKLQLNAEKYPIEKSFNSNKKYTEF